MKADALVVLMELRDRAEKLRKREEGHECEGRKSEEFIDEGIVTLATANETQQAGTTFNATFNLLHQAYGADAMRRFQNGVPGGRVGLAAFEGIAVGIAKNIAHIQDKPNPVDYLRRRIKEF